MDRTKLSLNIITWGLGILGLFFGWHLAFHSHLEYFKMLTFVGILFDLLGVVLVTYAVLFKDQIQSVIADQLSRAIILSAIAIPISMSFSAVASIFFDAKSYESVIKFASAYALTITPPMLIIFLTPVLDPIFGREYEPEKRIKILGSICIILGFVFQLISSIIDIAAGY